MRLRWKPVLASLSAVAAGVAVTLSVLPETRRGESSRAAVAAEPAAIAERPAAPPLPDAKPTKETGITLTVESLVPGAAGAAPATDTRTARVFALYVPARTPPTPFLPAGPFRAVFESDIVASFKDDYAFSADGRGRVTVTLNGTIVLEASGEDLSAVAGKPVTLKKGDNRIVIRYESPAAGDAAFRLYWTGSEAKVREPIPWMPTAGFRRHDVSDKALRTGERLRHGRELLATLRCLKCHADGAAPSPQDMPELSMDAPDLSDAGARLHGEWVAKWLADPAALRTEAAAATCPKIAADPAEAADMAAYLATLGKPADPGPAPSEEDAKKFAGAGGKLFVQLGCLSCHTLPNRDDWADAKERVPLRLVSAKWRPAALKAFLKQPDRHYKWVRMPNFQFSDDEAGKLAAFLLTPAKAEAGSADISAGDAARGKSLVASAGCLSCHTAGAGVANAAKAPALAAIPAAGWSRGCVAPKVEADAKRVPDFKLTDDGRAALIAFAATDRRSLRVDTPGEFAERQIRLLRCSSCHKRDDRQEDPWEDLKEEAEGVIAEAGGWTEEEQEEAKHYPPEQIRPSLTWTGEKLRPEWSAAFLAGKVKYKPRPYLRARMPAFAVRAEGLARGLTLEHGFPVTQPDHPAPKAEESEVGRKLAGKNGGLACTACHAVGSYQAVGVFEAPGVNFVHVRERITKRYYDRWLVSPLRVEPGTKMPQFWKEGRTDIAAVYGGDASRQFAALWEYLLHGEKVKPPEE